VTECIEYLREAIGEAVAFGSKHAETTARANLASALAEVGRLAEAKKIGLDNLTAARQLGHRLTEARLLHILGDIAHSMGEFDDAIARLTDSLELCATLSINHMTPTVQAELIWTQTAKSHSVTTEDRERLAHIVENVDAIDALSAAAAAYLDGGDLETARPLLERLADNIQKKNPQHCDSVVLAHLAKAHLLEGNLDAAAEVARAALSIGRAIPSLITAGQSLTTLAAVAMRRGNHEQAVATAREALELHRETGHRPGEADTLALFGDLYEDDQHRRQAVALYAEMGISPRGR